MTYIVYLIENFCNELEQLNDMLRDWNCILENISKKKGGPQHCHKRKLKKD